MLTQAGEVGVGGGGGVGMWGGRGRGGLNILQVGGHEEGMRYVRG